MAIIFSEMVFKLSISVFLHICFHFIAVSPEGSQYSIYWHCCAIFAITREPLKLRPPVSYCKRVFFRAYFEVLGMNLWPQT